MIRKENLGISFEEALIIVKQSANSYLQGLAREQRLHEIRK